MIKMYILEEINMIMWPELQRVASAIADCQNLPLFPLDAKSAKIRPNVALVRKHCAASLQFPTLARQQIGKSKINIIVIIFSRQKQVTFDQFSFDAIRKT